MACGCDDHGYQHGQTSAERALEQILDNQQAILERQEMLAAMCPPPVCIPPGGGYPGGGGGGPYYPVPRPPCGGRPWPIPQ
jgi:hypothetical protein